MKIRIIKHDAVHRKVNLTRPYTLNVHGYCKYKFKINKYLTSAQINN